MEYEIDFYIFLIHLLNQALMQTLWLIYISLIWYSTGLLGEASETNEQIEDLTNIFHL